MGLFGSLRSYPGQKKGLRFMKKDVRRPVLVQILVLRGHVPPPPPVGTSLESNTTQPLAECTLHRYYQAPDVLSFDIRFGAVRGRLYLPPGEAKQNKTDNCLGLCMTSSIV